MSANFQSTFIQVKEKIYLSPNYVRIIFHCEDVHQFSQTTIGDNNKLFIPDATQSQIELPQFDFEQRKWRVEHPECMPHIRTYTHRAIDLLENTLTIEFAMHGTDTLTCRWVDQAQVGDQIGITMGKQPRELVPAALSHYLIITDPTGLAVTQAILESLDHHAKAYVIAETPSDADRIPLQSKAELKTIWLNNDNPLQHSLLADCLTQHPELIQLPAPRFAHITAELQAVRACRNILRQHSDWSKQDCYACAYWQIGKKDSERLSKRVDD
ncbi:siderophore-interacting protein [Acinetobacter larvae]|uniref:NADPH-dependent ferric siderophore reductase n=1 Tax=Acinetobacter larvae TaxID=1789224 RepID=A0A1B2LZV6_9GAMM|nr:siderophore-interacting protein [Acinetobacter larvae]AOA58472.1 NADPH-dependent ferric siderophore reductase [Acinetobacter larvae]